MSEQEDMAAETRRNVSQTGYKGGLGQADYARIFGSSDNRPTPAKIDTDAATPAGGESFGSLSMLKATPIDSNKILGRQWKRK